jgi:aspartate kinase
MHASNMPNEVFQREVLVQKYGGSSVASLAQMRAVAEGIAARHRAGHRVIVVVSARGGTTDELLRAAAEFNAAPAGRELDQLLATGETASSALLAMALQAAGIPAAALNGAKSGILASGRHGAGVIVAIDTGLMLSLLAEGKVVVVAGFQGTNEDGDIVTLGRGGSDTTAVAVAAELGSSRCEIYTDVDGVYTADPRVVSMARRMPEIDLAVMTEMSFAGAQVMHPRAVELAALCGVDIHVKHSSADGPGTVIRREVGGEMLEGSTAVRAVVHDADVARVAMRVERTDRDSVADVFRFLARMSISVDMANLSEGDEGGFSVGLTVRRPDVPAVRRSMSEMAARWGGWAEVNEDVGMVSVVGSGLLSRPECAARMLSALNGAAIATSAVSASQTRISVTVPRTDVLRGVGVLHSEFGLDAPARSREPARQF